MPPARIFAPSVYVGTIDSVNANISSLSCSSSQPLSLPSLYAACERAGIAPRDLAGFLYDRLSQHPDAGGACPQGTEGTVGPCPPSTLDVLRALLSHANREHDRVFASQACLAQETGKGETTVGVVIGWLRAVGAVRRIDDPEELLAGDGPHRA